MKSNEELGCGAQYRHKWSGKAGSSDVAELTNGIKLIWAGKQNLTVRSCQILF